MINRHSTRPRHSVILSSRHASACVRKRCRPTSLYLIRSQRNPIADHATHRIKIAHRHERVLRQSTNLSLSLLLSLYPFFFPFPCILVHRGTERINRSWQTRESNVWLHNRGLPRPARRSVATRKPVRHDRIGLTPYSQARRKSVFPCRNRYIRDVTSRSTTTIARNASHPGYLANIPPHPCILDHAIQILRVRILQYYGIRGIIAGGKFLFFSSLIISLENKESCNAKEFF